MKTTYLKSIVLIGHGLLAIPAIIVLSKLNFPDILTLSGQEAFPIIQQQPGNLIAGFGLFFLYSLLFLPASAIVSEVAMKDVSHKNLHHYLAVAGATLRSLWWALWLTVIPLMATLYFAPETTGTMKETLSLLFRILNETFSTISEDVGVNIFSSLWALVISLAIIKHGNFPKWMGYFGLVGSLLYLISSSELLGLGSIEIAQSMAPPVSGLWFTTLGVILFRRSYRK